MDIFNEVNKINLPVGEYAVVGGGVLAAYGLRKHNDVDFIVTPNLYKKLITEGWTKDEKKDFVVRSGNYEASLNFCYKNYKPNTLDLIKNAVFINNIPFIQLTELLKFKKELGRDKDKMDIKLINSYLMVNVN